MRSRCLNGPDLNAILSSLRLVPHAPWPSVCSQRISADMETMDPARIGAV